MKGMRKISRGKSFRGVVMYGFEGEKDNARELEGRVVGGNMSGHDPESLIAEFEATVALKPNIGKPVWHNSLRLPKGEKLSDEQWDKIGQSYMKKMGFTARHPYVCILHDDEAGQHIHIIASRIAMDSQLFLGQNEHLISTKVIEGLEVEFGLTITKGVEHDDTGKVVMPAKRKVGKAEMEKALRTDEEPARYQLQKLVDQALQGPTTATQFVERLQAAGVEVKVNIASTGRLNGFSFGLNGVHFGGQKLGDAYKYSSLIKRGLNYEQDRESEFLKQFSAQAGERGIDTRFAQSHPGTGLEQNRGGRLGGDRLDPAGAEQHLGEPGIGHSEDHGEDREHLRRDPGREDHAGQPGTDHVDRSGAAEGPGTAPAAAAGDTGGAGQTQRAPGQDGKNAVRDPGLSGPAVDRRDVPHLSAIDAFDGVESIRTGDKVSDDLVKKSSDAMKKSTQERADASQKFWKMLAAQLEAAEQKRRTAAIPKRSGYHRDRLLDLVALHLPIRGNWNESAVRKMLNGFGVQAFEVRVVDNAPGTQNKAQVRQYQGEALVELKNLKWLRQMNGQGRDIYIRPARPEASGIVLVDDLNQAQLSDLNALGLKPSLILETSPGNHQAWIRINSTGFSAIEHKAILGFITDAVGGDKASIDQQHFGRLAGFTNRKSVHVKADGTYPLVNLLSSDGGRAPGGEDLLEKVRQDLSRQAELDRETRLLIDAESAAKRQSNLALGVDLSNPLPAGFLAEKWHAIEQDFVRKGQVPDLSAIDFGAAMALGSRNVPIGEALRIFEAELPNAGRKGLHLDDYILRTVTKAYARVELSNEGFTGGKADLMAEARQRFPHLFDGPLKKRTIAPALKTSNQAWALQAAERAREAIAELEESLEKEGEIKLGE